MELVIIDVLVIFQLLVCCNLVNDDGKYLSLIKL